MEQEYSRIKTLEDITEHVFLVKKNGKTEELL